MWQGDPALQRRGGMATRRSALLAILPSLVDFSHSVCYHVRNEAETCIQVPDVSNR